MLTGDALTPVSTVPHLELRLAQLRGCPQICVPQSLFEEPIEHDEKIARSHFLDIELRHTLIAIDPGIRYDRIPVAAQIDLSGSSTVKLKCWASSGWTPAITVRRYILDAFEMSSRGMRNSSWMNLFPNRFNTSFRRDRPLCAHLG